MDSEQDNSATIGSAGKSSGLRRLRALLNNAGIGDLFTISTGVLGLLSFFLYNSLNNNISAQNTLITNNKTAISSFDDGFSRISGDLEKIKDKIDKGTEYRIAEISEVKANYQIHSAKLDVIGREMNVKNSETAEEIKKAYSKEISDLKALTDKILDSVATISANLEGAEKIAAKATENATHIESLGEKFYSTNNKLDKLGLLLELEISDVNVRQAMVRLANNNPVKLADAASINTLWSYKSKLTTAEFNTYLTENFAINPTDSYLLVYDELSTKRPLGYFLQKKDIRSIQIDPEPELGALTPEDRLDENTTPNLNSIEVYSLLEKVDLEAERMSIISVCSLLSPTPLSECYRTFLQKIGEIDGEEAKRAKAISNAVKRALIKKYGQ